MNAHKFVAEKGIDEAKRVLSGAPKNAVYYRDMDSVCSPNEILYYAWFGGALLVKDQEKGWIKSIYHTGSEYILDQLEKVEELKQVVESVEIIDRLFGLDQAKHTMKIAKEIGYTSDYEQIKQAIADYELVESYKQVKVEVGFGIALQSNQSIGAKCEVLDMVDVSPNCEVRNG